jgi:hypothetical protein
VTINDFDTRKFCNLVRNATQNFQGVVTVVYIEPARHEHEKDKAIYLSRKLAIIDPTIGEIRNRAPFSNVYMPPVIFKPGSPGKEAADIIGHFGAVIDEDADAGKHVILPPGIVPTFIIETSRTGETVNHQYWFIFDRIISAAEGKKFRELLYSRCGGDPIVKNPAQPFRVPGTLNHPNLTKINRGRSLVPQATKIVGGTGQMVNFDALVAALQSMPDRVDVKQAARAPAVEVDWASGPGMLPDEIGLKGWVRGGQTDIDTLIKRLPDDIREKMAEADSGGDRSTHCRHLMLSLCEFGLTDDETYRVSGGLPFALKFWTRGASGLCKEINRARIAHMKNCASQAEAEKMAARLASKIVPIRPEPTPPPPGGRRRPVTDGSAAFDLGAEHEEAETEEQAPHQDPHGAPKWPELQPLAKGGDALDYPIEDMPGTIRNAVVEVQSFTQSPLPMVATSALISISAAAQALVDVARDRLLVGPVSLYSLTLGDSGERKSQVDKLFTRAIKDFQRQQAEELAPEVKRLKSEQDAWEAKRRGILDNIQKAEKDPRKTNTSPEGLKKELIDHDAQKPPEIFLPCFIRGDDTTENLAWALAKEWPSGAVIEAEAGVIFGAHAMQPDKIMAALAQKQAVGRDFPIPYRTPVR